MKKNRSETISEIIIAKIKKLERDKKNNYQVESYYVDIDSKLEILNELLTELKKYHFFL
jgi:hypothetical protein